MIKIIVDRKGYNYEGVGSSQYDVKNEISLWEDINTEDAIRAYVEALISEEFSRRNIVDCLRNVADDLEDTLKVESQGL